MINLIILMPDVEFKLSNEVFVGLLGVRRFPSKLRLLMILAFYSHSVAKSLSGLFCRALKSLAFVCIPDPEGKEGLKGEEEGDRRGCSRPPFHPSISLPLSSVRVEVSIPD